MKPRVACLAWVALAACSGARTPAAQPRASSAVVRSPAQRFDAFARAYFDQRFTFSPTEATVNGVHTYDAALDDLSRDGVARQRAFLVRSRDALVAMIPALPASRTPAREEGTAASDHPQLDATMLRDAIALELEKLDDWHALETHPGTFHALAADAVYELLVRDFAPAPTRLRNATARLRAIPALLTAGQAWLTNPPRLAVDVALREIVGSIEMVRDVFPDFARRAGGSPDDLAAALAASTEATHALERHRDWLRDVLMPRSTGDFHDGRARWIERARLGNGVSEPPELVRDAALSEVRRLQTELRTIAARLARPGETPPQVLARLRANHPSPAGLLDAYRGQLDGIRAFVREHHLVTIDPARDTLTVVETPAFLRATIFAAVNSAGPLETGDRTTFFWVTPPDLTRPPAEIEAYMTEHSLATIDSTVIHEAYPGHHVQAIHGRLAPSLVRRILWPGTYGEGWAHYCEQMVVDQGFGDDTMRAAQRMDALLRASRAYLDVQVHVFGASYDDAVRFYRDEGMLSQPGAEMEARRVCLEPASVFIYTYGKFAILRLRRAVGERMSLAAFHDALLDFGPAPLADVARLRFGVELPAWSVGETP